MIKGTMAKEELKKELLELYPNAFENGKEIRIPKEDKDGEIVELKITLTVAKVPMREYQKINHEESKTPTQNEVDELYELIHTLNV